MNRGRRADEDWTLVAIWALQPASLPSPGKRGCKEGPLNSGVKKCHWESGSKVLFAPSLVKCKEHVRGDARAFMVTPNSLVSQENETNKT